MPKSSSKKKNLNTNNSKLNKETNISGKNSDDILIDIKLPFPPTLTINDLIKDPSKPSTSNKVKTFPSAFIAYRTALIKEYRINNSKLPPMGKFSKIAKNSWDREPKHVKDSYNKLIMNAKSIYNRNNIQIVLDKHMDHSINYAEKNQESGHVLRQVDSHVTTYSAEFDHARILPIEDTIHSENLLNCIQNSAVDAVNLSHHSLYNTSLINFFPDSGMNSTQENTRMMEREIDGLKDYIRTLEQIIDSLPPRN